MICSLARGVASPVMFSAGGTPESVEILDVDGDGHKDVVSANSTSGELCVNVGNGSGQFGPPIGYDTGLSSSNLAMADLNDDGRDDFVVANSNGFVQIMINNSTSIDLQQIIRGDIDGDGVLGIGDAILTLAHLFAGESVACADAVDVNDDGSLGLDDTIVLLSAVFGGSAGLTGLCEQDFTDDFLPLCYDAGSCEF